MRNPFKIRWLKGWTFQIVYMNGKINIEANGFGIGIRTELLPGESPITAADRLVYTEDRKRKTLYYLWKARKLKDNENIVPKKTKSNIAKKPAQIIFVH